MSDQPILFALEGLETQMELEACTIATAGAGAESQEGIGAYLAKRKPDFERV